MFVCVSVCVEKNFKHVVNVVKRPDNSDNTNKCNSLLKNFCILNFVSSHLVKSQNVSTNNITLIIVPKFGKSGTPC